MYYMGDHQVLPEAFKQRQVPDQSGMYTHKQV